MQPEPLRVCAPQWCATRSKPGESLRNVTPLFPSWTMAHMITTRHFPWTASSEVKGMSSQQPRVSSEPDSDRKQCQCPVSIRFLQQLLLHLLLLFRQSCVALVEFWTSISIRCTLRKSEFEISRPLHNKVGIGNQQRGFSSKRIHLYHSATRFVLQYTVGTFYQECVSSWSCWFLSRPWAGTNVGIGFPPRNARLQKPVCVW